MGNQRTTFGKLQRERDKKAKAIEKAEKRAARQAEAKEADDEPDGPPVDQTALIEALAELHQRFEAKGISIDEFEERREQLTERLGNAVSSRPGLEPDPDLRVDQLHRHQPDRDQPVVFPAVDDADVRDGFGLADAQ